MTFDGRTWVRLGWMAALGLGGCTTDDSPPASAESGGSTSTEASSSVASSSEAGSSGAVPTGSSSGGTEACTLLDEGIAFPRLDVLGPDDGFGDVPCDVTDAGFSCTFDTDPELVDIDGLLGSFASVPWSNGDAVRISGTGPYSSGYEASLTVRSPDAELLAFVVWNLTSTIDPFELTLEDVGCIDPATNTPALQATYTLGDESLTLLGSGSGPLGEYTVYQEDASDYSTVSGGELGDTASYAIVRNP